MSFLDRFKKDQAENEGVATAAEKKASEAQQKAAENEGLPSVNRRSSNGGVMKYVALAGALIFVVVAISMNSGDKAPKQAKKKGGNEGDQVVNNMPPIDIPPAALPVQPSAAPVVLTPAPQGGQPFQLAGIDQNRPQTPQFQANGKPVQDWTERKMSGSLLVGQQPGAPAAAPAFAPPAADPMLAARGAGGGNELSAKLEPTITKGVSASMLPDRNFLIAKGTSLDCALETALDSTVAGLTTCRLTRDVYSDNGKVLLLDRGSQLVGEYQGGLKQGQVRLFVLWTRAKTPNGVVVNLNSPGTDSLGRSGLEGWVDNHFLDRFGAAILMSYVKESAVALTRGQNSNSGTTVNYGNTAMAGEKIIEKILDSTVNIPPTIVKNQGDTLQVMVARDLDFSAVYALKSK